MEIECKILGFEERVSQKGGKYWRFETSNGFLNCFDSSVADEVKEFVDGMCTLAVQESKNGYKHIIGIADGKPMNKPTTRMETPENDKYKAMYVSYAKDIFISLYENGMEGDPYELMKFATDLIKQTKDAF